MVSSGDILSQRGLGEVIEHIAEQSGYTFNYDTEAISDFQVDEYLWKEYSQSEIATFFAGTPFDISMDGDIIIILPLRKRKGTICGTIVSEEDGESLPFASVLLDNGEVVVADKNGYFEKEADLYQRQYGEISYVGRNPARMLVDSLERCPTILLSAADGIGQSVLIKSYILHGIDEGGTYGGVSLNLDLLSNNHSMRQAGIFHSTQMIPGISSPDDSATGINIRGGTTDHNLILWEGVPMYGQGYLYGMISQINPYSVDRVMVYKSNHSAALDNRIGGVVDMHLPDNIPDGLSSSIGANMTEGHINLALPVLHGKGGLLLAGRKSGFAIFEENSPTYLGFFKKIFNTTTITQEEEEEGVEEQEPNIDYYDINAKGIFQLSKSLTVKSSILLSQSQSSNFSVFSNSDSESQDDQSTKNNLFTLELKYDVDDVSEVRLIGRRSSYTNEAESILQQTNTASALLENEESNSIADLQMELAYGRAYKNLTTELGYVFDSKSTKFESEQKSAQLGEVSSETGVAATFHHLYTQSSFVTGRMLLEGGCRLSFDSNSSSFFASPSVSSRVKLIKGVFHKMSAGWYHQFIKQIYRAVDTDLIVEEPIWTLNQVEDDAVLNAGKLTTGLIFKRGGWLVDAEVYIHDSRGLSVENPNIRNVISTERRNQLISKGMDLLISKRIGKFNSSLQYSLAENRITVPSLEEDENDSFIGNNDQTHILRATQLYAVAGMNIGLTYVYKTGMPYTSNSKIVISDDDYYDLEHAQINNARLADYHRLDLAWSSSLRWKNKTIEVSAGVLNLLNRNNIGSRKSILQPSATGDEPQLLEINKSLLPRTFQASARLFF